MTKRVLDLEADYKALSEYKDRLRNKPRLRTKTGNLSLFRLSFTSGEGTKEAFCGAQSILFNEAKANWDGAFISYWGNLVGASVGMVSGAAGVVGGTYLGVQYLVQAEQQEKIMEQALVTMDATAENMERAGC